MSAGVETAKKAGLICPKHGKLLDRSETVEKHKGSKVTVVKEIKFKCGCVETQEA